MKTVNKFGIILILGVIFFNSLLSAIGISASPEKEAVLFVSTTMIFLLGASLFLVE